MINLNRKRKTLITILIVFFVMVCYCIWSDYTVKDKGVFTIGTLNKIEGARSGLRLSFSFNFKGVNYNIDYIEPIGNVYMSDIGKRFFIQVLPDNPNNQNRVVVNIRVPDNIEPVPFNGWSKKWIEYNYPKCLQ